jgi:hypothetical protein
MRITDLARNHLGATVLAALNKADVTSVPPVLQPAKKLDYWEEFEKENPSCLSIYMTNHRR